MAEVLPYQWLYVNRLKPLIKRQRLAKQKNKDTNPTICSLQEIHFRLKDTIRLKMKRLKKIFHVNSNRES